MEQREPLHTAGGNMNRGTGTVGNRMEAPQKLKIELPHYPATSLLGMYLKKTNKSTC